MKKEARKFTLHVDNTKGICPIGEKTAQLNMDQGKIPVLSCEGACIRGEIARTVANIISKDESYRRGCHGEIFSVPDSTMAEWASKAEKVVIIDGCFLKCFGRILKNIVGSEKLIQIDALSYYRKYSDLFDIDSVPQEERTKVAREVAGKILANLNKRDI